MTKEAFVENKKFIDSEIEKMRALRKELEAEYIEANKPFSIGDRVKKVDKNEFGFVAGFRIDYSDNVTLDKVLKEKKDGTESKNNMWIYSSNDVELAPKPTDKK